MRQVVRDIFFFLVLLTIAIVVLLSGFLMILPMAALLVYGIFRFRELRIAAARIIVTVFFLFAVVVLVCFPYDHDGQKSIAAAEDLQKYYRNPSAIDTASPELEAKFDKTHEQNKVRIAQFIGAYGLQNKKILDVGSGSGYLQDSVADYTGLDIQSRFAPLYHKPYVLASATEMPFQDSSFDAAWSITVLEHVPNPERMLNELRRVLKNGSLLFFDVGWSVQPWVSEGYEVRPYSDFALAGKMIKATMPFRKTLLYAIATNYPVRLVRYSWNKLHGGPSRLRYHLLHPSTSKYWQEDADAVNSIDRFEVIQWFTTRGDECLDCSNPFQITFHPLILRIHK
jgi:SAM-dependent methyltransferase